jgi:hypothetical protein
VTTAVALTAGHDRDRSCTFLFAACFNDPGHKRVDVLECCPTPGRRRGSVDCGAVSVNDCTPERMAVRSSGASAYSWPCLPADAAEQPSAYGIPAACDGELWQGARRSDRPGALRVWACSNG